MAYLLKAALFGECMLELTGQPFGMLRQSFGGDTLNTAIYLQRLVGKSGVDISYATALGTDAFSDGMLQAWQMEGLNNRLVHRIAERVPGLYAIQVDDRGERRFYYWRDSSAARAHFDRPDTPLEAAARTDLDLLHFSGISLAILPEAGRHRLLQACKAVRARGGMVAFDNNYRPRLWRDAAEARKWFDQALSHATIALLTLDDEMALTGENDPEAEQQRIFAMNIDEIVVKRGREDTLVRDRARGVARVPTVEVANVVDTTAAGDSFAGAYLAARLLGRSPVEAASAGNRLAAAVIQYPGAIIPLEAMPSL